MPIGANRAGIVSQVGNAIPDSVLDNFEADLYDNQSLTLSDRYGGDLSNFTRQQTTVYEGSYALSDDGAATNYVAIMDTDRTAQQGDTISVRALTDSGSGWSGFLFGTQGESGSAGNYGVLIDWGGFLSIRKDMGADGGGESGTLLQETSWSPNSSTWYQFIIDWQTDDTIALTIADESGAQVASISATDATYTSGGTGYWYNGDNWGGGGWDLAEVL